MVLISNNTFFLLYIKKPSNMTSHAPKEGCCNVVTLQEGKTIGSVQQVSDFRTYVVGDLKVGGKYIVIFTDIYGLDLVNTQLVADQFHKHTGYTVVVPDIVNNDPYSTGDLMEWFSNGHTVEFNKKLTSKFLEIFSSEYKPSYSAGIGYCFGAKYIIQNSKKGDFFDVVAIAHPSFVTEEEFEEVAIPIIISAAQVDSVFTPELRMKSEKILNKNGLQYQIDLYSGTSHGFTVRGDRSNPDIKYAAEKALLDQVTWFKRFDNDSSSSCSCLKDC